MLQRDRDDHGRFMSVSIKYPKFTGMEDLNLDNVNSLVKEAAFAPLCDDGSTVEDAVAALEKEQENLSTSTSCDVDYKLLYVGDDYISLVFHMFACVGGPSAVHDYMVTLDIKEGRCVYFNDYADTSQALSAIVSGEFTVYEGTCNDVTEEYVHNSETCSRLAKIFRENIYAGGPDGKFDRYSSQNIGLDEEGLYIFISVPDQDVVQSFHGYFILRIPLESIKEPKKKEQPEEGEAQQGNEFELYQMLNDDLFGNGFLKDFYYSDISQIEETESLYQNVIQELDGGEFLFGYRGFIPHFSQD